MALSGAENKQENKDQQAIAQTERGHRLWAWIGHERLIDHPTSLNKQSVNRDSSRCGCESNRS